MSNIEDFHVGFTGTRSKIDLVRFAKLNELLRKAKLKYLSLWFHHGDCIGCDKAAHVRAVSLGIKVIIHPPEIEKYRAWCAGAAIVLPMKRYLDRNKDIVDLSNVLIAMPKTIHNEELRSGTWATIRYARKKGIQVVML